MNFDTFLAGLMLGLISLIAFMVTIGFVIKLIEKMIL